MDRVVAGEVARRMRARADREEREARQSREAASTRRTFVRMPEDGQDEGHSICTNMGPSHAAREAEDERPSCRICFGDGDVEELGRLFSPCLCRGTNSHVHTECLNSWRRLSSNANSYWRCDQCKYNYRTVKLGHVDILQNPALVTTAAALLILAVSLLAGFVVTCILPGPAHVARLYKMLSFVPPWKAKLVDMCFVGFFLIGLGGFGIVVYFRVTRYPQYFMHVVVPSLVFSTLANGFRFLRVVACKSPSCFALVRSMRSSLELTQLNLCSFVLSLGIRYRVD